MRDLEGYWPTPDFWFQMVCILLAGVNFLVFWFVIRKQLERLPDDADVSVSAKALGLPAISPWIRVIRDRRMSTVLGVG